MTDVRKPAKVAPRIGWSPTEWRAYLATALAGVYTAVWLAVAPGAEAPPPTAPPVPEHAPAVTTAPSTTPRAIWIDDLPAASRPRVALPAGWTLAPRTAGAPTAIARTPSPRLRAAPRPSRTVRVRTRSS